MLIYLQKSCFLYLFMLHFLNIPSDRVMKVPVQTLFYRVIMSVVPFLCYPVSQAFDGDYTWPLYAGMCIMQAYSTVDTIRKPTLSNANQPSLKCTQATGNQKHWNLIHILVKSESDNDLCHTVFFIRKRLNAVSVYYIIC